MTEDEGLNVNQGRVEVISKAAQSVLNGKSTLGDSASQPALNEDLLQRVLSPLNLQTAWQQVKKNKGSPGVDGVTLPLLVEALPLRAASE